MTYLVLRSGQVLAAVGIVLAALAGGVHADDGEAFFESKIRPLLVERCAECHGDDRAKGGLSLASRGAILAGGDSGPAAEEGRPAESLLLEAVRYESEPRMPPGGRLSGAEIADLEHWIAQGMPWPEAHEGRARPDADASTDFQISEGQREFWAFRPVERPEPPAVGDESWPRTAIDRFLLARLEAEGLRPAPEADRRTLIRRLSIDLTGLPPDPDRVEAFVADPDPDAYERLVDELLASPHHGERWARHWLDVVRYADSLDSRGSGQPGDILDAWRYRDWVVDALNDDMPYEKFVRYQVAGDALPPEAPGDGSEGFNRSGTIASTVLAIGNWGNGDADKEKILTDIADDQVDLVGRAFLGLTIACARCHDHKFDPISTADYYGLAGIFFSTHILPELTPKGAGETIIRVPLASEAELARRDEHARQLATLEGRIAEESGRRAAALADRLRAEGNQYLMALHEYESRPEERAGESLDAFAEGRGLHAFALRKLAEALGSGSYELMENRVDAVLGTDGVVAWEGSGTGASATINTTESDHVLLTFRLPARSVSVHPSPANGVVVAWTSPIAGRVRVSGRLLDGDPAGGDGVAWAVDLRSADGLRQLASGDLPNGGGQELAAGDGGDRLEAVEVRPGDRVELVVLPKESHICDTTTVELSIAEVDGPSAWDLAADLLGEPTAGNPSGDRQGNGEVWRFEDMADASRPAFDEHGHSPGLAWRERLAGGADPDRLESAAASLLAQLDPGGEADPFRPTLPRDEAALPDEDRAALASLRAELEALRAATPPPLDYANAAKEGGVPKSPHEGVHDVHVHIRGRYDRLGPLVPRRFPTVLTGEGEPPPSIGQGSSGRRELAGWLARPENPLTARVMVNRLWQHHFGRGIVGTPGNFGELGERPTHPELLDWLASAFVESGWSIKAMHREIVNSAAYRQSSVVDAEALERDPENLLLGRMNRRRLEAEILRDALLAASGRLDLRRGGPADRDPGSTRRGLYVITIRSDRATFGALFDQADSTAPVDVRTVATVAPQALYLLNHPFVLAQAEGLAGRLLGSAGDDRGRIDHAYRLLFARPPGAEEVALGLELLADARGAGEPEEQAWAAYAHILLCSNEFVYVD